MEIAIIILSVLSAVGFCFLLWTIKYLSESLKLHNDIITNIIDRDDEIYCFCLKSIMNNAIEKEDYETAKACADLLKQYE